MWACKRGRAATSSCGGVFVYNCFSYSKMPMYYLYVDFFSRFLSKLNFVGYKKKHITHVGSFLVDCTSLVCVDGYQLG